MRVISGNKRGAKLITVENESVRPTTDRVKESMFNLMGTSFSDCRVLDLFAGSGALGIEAVSRGAVRCVCVDTSKTAQEAARKNYNNLHLTEYAEFFLCNAEDYLKKCREKFDIIFLDPPYNKGLIPPVMSIIKEKDLLSENGMIVLESDTTDVPGEFSGFVVLKQRKYGRTYVTLYEKEG